MRLYFSLAANKVSNRVFIGKNYDCLISYYYTKGELKKWFIEQGLLNTKTLVDSGAFSAFNSGKVIELKDYIKFLKEVGAEIYSALDVIGDPHETLLNYNKMKEQGMNPIPCFHTGEPLKFLDEILHENYISLGGMVHAEGVEDWLDKVFNYIFKKNPLIKIHGFGLTDPNLMLKYPWYSVDSSSWLACVKYGRFSKWNQHKRLFSTISVQEFFNLSPMEWTKGDKINGALMDHIIEAQVGEFMQMVEYLLHKKNTRDYNYITSQQTLF